MGKLDIVIVTFNRLDKLKHTLQCYASQTTPFRNLIVVDNASTDGTHEYLDEWNRATETPYQRIVIHSTSNVGGSGGFYLGQKKAMELGADWVFVADDDAYPAADMVEQFYRFINNHDTSRVSAVCAAVYNMSHELCLYHRDRCHRSGLFGYARVSASKEEYARASFPIDFLSYVGSFLNGEALKKCGLVNRDYFIYFDDSEHSLRLKKYGDILVVPAIRIVHEGGAEATQAQAEILVSWRDYYLQRNQQHMLLHHMPSVGLYRAFIRLKRRFGDVLRRRRSDAASKLYCRAFSDALFNRMGIHGVYKPGWQIKREKP